MANERAKGDANYKSGGVVGGYSSADAIGATDPTLIMIRIDPTTGRVLVDSNAASTQYTEGDTDATITGNVVMWEDAANTIVATSAAKPLPISGTVTANLGATDNAVLDAIQTATEATKTAAAKAPKDFRASWLEFTVFLSWIAQPLTTIRDSRLDACAVFL